MWRFRDGDIIEELPDFNDVQRQDKRTHRFICSNDGGNILSLYIRGFGIGSHRLFQAINMFQCDKCFAFFAMEDGTRRLVALEVKRKTETPLKKEKGR